jgi:hypothetical protein
MTLPTPSELPHPRCPQFYYHIVYRPSVSLGLKKANLGIGNPQSPGVAAVSVEVKGRRLSADRVGHVWRRDMYRAHRSGRPALLGHLRVPCDVLRRVRRPSGGSFAPSSLRVQTGRPRPSDPGARPIPTSSRPEQRQYRTPFPRCPSHYKDVVDRLCRILQGDAPPGLLQGAGEREILSSEPVRLAIPQDATAVPSALGGRSQSRRQIDRRRDRRICVLSGERRPLVVSLYSRPSYTTYPPAPA